MDDTKRTSGGRSSDRRSNTGSRPRREQNAPARGSNAQPKFDPHFVSAPEATPLRPAKKAPAAPAAPAIRTAAQPAQQSGGSQGPRGRRNERPARQNGQPAAQNQNAEHHGTTAALALLNDAVKKGGVMASNHVGGLSGAFIPVSEDEGMIAAARQGALHLDKLEAMTCVCSVGLDMIAVPGDTSAETISAIIADEAAIGMVNTKTTAVRIIPAPGKTVGDTVEFGGLLGSAPVIPVHPFSSAAFIQRGGRIPAPMQSLKN